MVLTIIAIAIILLFAINGAKKGLIDGIVHLISYIVAIAVIFIIAKGIGNFLQKSYINVIVALILLVSIRIIDRVLKLITDSLELAAKLPVLNFTNHVLGFAFGTIRGLLFTWILFLLVGYFNIENVNNWISAQVGQNILISTIYKTNMIVPLLLMIQ